MIICNLCGKEIEGWNAYYIVVQTRISQTKEGQFENNFYGIKPVFYACSQEHYNMLLKDFLDLINSTHNQIESFIDMREIRKEWEKNKEK